MLRLMERRRLVVGNWKMELSYKGQVELARSLKKSLPSVSMAGMEVVVCPSYSVLAEVKEVLKGSGVFLGAQHVHWEERGAWTGEVSVTQIAPLVQWCIIGHSEQRSLSGVTDEQVQSSASILLQHGLVPIVCLGETVEERAADRTVEKITTQMNVLLRRATRAALAKLVVAYEPMWAIGTGVMPDPTDAASVMLLIRKLVAGRFGSDAAERMRVIYGGSVTPDTIAPYVAEPGVDGVLVGGASVQPLRFVEIVKVVRNASG